MSNLLGYNPKDIIGKNIDYIMPRPLSIIHDSLIRRYFSTAKSKILNQTRQMFAMNKEGYLKVITALIKVYPSLSDKIMFVGYL